MATLNELTEFDSAFSDLIAATDKVFTTLNEIGADGGDAPSPGLTAVTKKLRAAVAALT